MAGKTTKKRSQIDAKYHWHIEDLYKSTEDWQKDFDRVKVMSEELGTYEGRLTESAKVLIEFLKKKNETGKLLEAVYVYANQKYHEDTSVSEFQRLSDLASGLMSGYYSAISFMEPELLGLTEETLHLFEKEEPKLTEYHRFFMEIFRHKEHTLSKEAETILADTTELADTASNVFSMFNNADLKFPEIEDEDGEMCAITHARYMNFLQSSDRRVRKDAFMELYHSYQKFKNTLGAAFIGNLKKDAFYAKVRKYPSCLAMALDDANVPEAVYHTLLETVHKNLHYLYQYLDLKKKALGVEELHLYDVYVPITPDFKKTVAFEDAKEIVKKALEPLGEEYGRVLLEGLENGWIDVYENEGKRSGAYSWGAYGTHPFVLLNYQDQLNDVFTLAHEMGHAMHSWFSDKEQPYLYASYKIFVAEVASTCNEALLMEYLLKHSTDKKEKAYLINYFLEQFRTTLYRQAMFAEFELLAHNLQESGGGVTTEKLCEIYKELNELYFGKEVVIDEEIAMEWARIPHFYNSYYVYQYATGYSAAIALSRRILKEGEPAVKDYLKFLQGGSSKDPIDLLKDAGVDMASPEPVEQALKLFGGINGTVQGGVYVTGHEGERITEDRVQKILKRGKLNEIAVRIQKSIVDIFKNSGIYYRIFYRVKTAKSLAEKLNRGGYGFQDGEKHVQDVIGLRIVLYYGDDLSIGQKIMKDTFLMIGTWEKTENKEDQFAASKINGVFRIPEEFMVNYKIPETELPIDSVFEIQFRTMFFEGWHEIEHDMRYKTHFADDAFWKGNPELSRMLNCIVANLELCDWSMLHLFDQLAEYHYKEQNWEMMLKSKFRLRISDQHLSEDFVDYFNKVPEAAEQIYRCTRSQLIESLMGTVHGDITYNLIIRILNERYVHNKEIAEICERISYIKDLWSFQTPPLQRLESSDVFCLEVHLRHREDVPLLEELRTAAEIVQRWAKNKMSDIFNDISEKPENYKRQTLGYQMVTSYHERLYYYEMEMYHLDMEHPGTIWQMQVLIHRVKTGDEYLTFWVHSICRHPQDLSAAAVFSKPLFVNELSAKVGLEDVELLKTSPVTIENEEVYERFLRLIYAKERRLPVVVLAAAEDGILDGKVILENKSFLGGRVFLKRKLFPENRKQLRRKKGDFYGILHVGKLAHIIGMYSHVYLLDREYSERFGKELGKEGREIFGSVSIYDCGSTEPSEFFTEEQILGSRFDYNRYVYYEGDVYEKAFRHKLVEMIKRKVLEKHPY